jgi:Spy/CpxP family protein refolding chaperone
MSFTTRSLSVAVLALGLAGAAFAQDNKTTTPDATKQSAERQNRIGRDKGHAMRGFGMGKMGRRGGFGRHGDLGRFAGITLTDAQKEQIKQIRETNKPDKAVMDEMRTIMQARRTGGTLTDAQKARVKEIRDQQQAKAKAVHEQIQNVLTADQKAQIEKRRTELKQRREEMQKKREEFRKNRLNNRTAPRTKTGN